MIGRQSFPVEEAPAEFNLLAQAFESAPLTNGMELLAGKARQAFRNRLTSSANPDNVNFAPRKKIGDGHPLLMDTGAMLQAFTGGGAGHIEQVGEREVTIGADGRIIPYAATHNYGRNWGRGAPIPQREVAGMTEDEIDDAADTLADAMLEVLG